MSGPGFAPPDLCSIRAAAEQEELAEAVRGGLSADGYPRGDDDPPAPLTSGIDRAIRLSTAVAVLAVAGIAAYVSYWHAYAVVRAHGETGITARLEPATIDGLGLRQFDALRGPTRCRVMLRWRRHGCWSCDVFSVGVVLVAGSCYRLPGTRSGDRGAGVSGEAAVGGAVLDGAR